MVMFASGRDGGYETAEQVVQLEREFQRTVPITGRDVRVGTGAFGIIVILLALIVLK
jgi:hypothetical protein